MNVGWSVVVPPLSPQFPTTFEITSASTLDGYPSESHLFTAQCVPRDTRATPAQSSSTQSAQDPNTTYRFRFCSTSSSSSLPMIIIRLTLHRRSTLAPMGSPGRRMYKTTITMFIESCALYAVSSFSVVGQLETGIADIFLLIFAKTQVRTFLRSRSPDRLCDVDELNRLSLRCSSALIIQ